MTTPRPTLMERFGEPCRHEKREVELGWKPGPNGEHLDPVMREVCIDNAIHPFLSCPGTILNENRVLDELDALWEVVPALRELGHEQCRGPYPHTEAAEHADHCTIIECHDPWPCRIATALAKLPEKGEVG